MRKRIIFVCWLILFTLLTAVQSLAWADEIQSPQTSDTVVKTGCIPWGNAAQWLTAIGVIFALGLSIWNWWRQGQDRKLTFDTELTKLTEDITIFWMLLGEAYDQYRANRADLQDRLSGLIRQVGPLPNPPVDDARDWRKMNAGKLSALSAVMLAFASAVYPIGQGVKDNVAANGLIKDKRFHLARGRLAHFWQNYGDSVSLRHLRNHQQNHDELLSILTWLEIALHECLDTIKPKDRLFKKASALWKNQL